MAAARLVRQACRGHHQTAISKGHLDGMPGGRHPSPLVARRARLLLIGALGLAALVSGCGSANDQFGGTVWVTPRKYAYHPCPSLYQIERGQAVRQKDLEELMARASQGAGGQVIGTMVYQTEYQQVLGERKALADMMREKRCGIEAGTDSERKVF